MLNLFKVEIHNLYHSKKLGLMEIGNQYGITAREALAIVEEVDKKKAKHEEEQKGRFAIKKRAGGTWVFTNKKHGQQPKKKFTKKQPEQKLPPLTVDTAMSLAMEKAGIK